MVERKNLYFIGLLPMNSIRPINDISKEYFGIPILIGWLFRSSIFQKVLGFSQYLKKCIIVDSIWGSRWWRNQIEK
ncbi:hypothetical protein MKW94_026066, partial [Papaver nudicaule]|nr:hypothetical protein [Papaver nudicaule]